MRWMSWSWSIVLAAIVGCGGAPSDAVKKAAAGGSGGGSGAGDTGGAGGHTSSSSDAVSGSATTGASTGDVSSSSTSGAGTGGASSSSAAGGESAGGAGPGGAGVGSAGPGPGGAGPGGAGPGGAADGGASSASSSGGASGCQSNADCDDDSFCNGAEVCDPANGDPVTGCASAGTPCDDGVACTVDTCDEAAKSCLHVPSDALCENGIVCDGTEFCNALLGCMSTGAPSCDDGISCTADFCDGASDGCKHVPDDKACSNGAFCDGAEKCDPANGAPLTGCVPGVPVACGDGIPCTIDTCDEVNDQCVHIPNAMACDDGVYCNGVETCDAALGCQSGTPVECDDGIACTADSCSEAQKTCVHAPSDAACDDGVYCNGVETCDIGTGCNAGTAVTCAPDNIDCTIDACDEPTQSCTHVADNTLCPAGQFCVLLQLGCTSGKPCASDAACQDGDLCNGVEACIAGICEPGTAIDCDDGVSCSTDTCDPASGACSHDPNDALCNDNLACNGVETCDAVLGCQGGTAVSCDDQVACTADACVEPNGTCSHTPVHFLCNDNKLCNGLEVCTPSGCQMGAPYVCPDDGIACTTQVCDPMLNACKAIPDSSVCPCGQTCDPLAGCGNYCTVKECQGKVYQCGDCLDNDGDCKIDDADSMCLGPCDNTESSFYGGIPGQNNSPCKSDCYFDQDTGAGNDDCYWSHKCDPLEVAPAYPPEGSQCFYNPNSNIPGYNGTCATAFTTQSAACDDYCGPLTPNGCDCFGCCAIPGAPTPVWLGSESNGAGTCTLAVLANPVKCQPCTQVPACLNTCEHCELCVGKTQLPADCQQGQVCPAGSQACGLVGQPLCPEGFTCITGCCQGNPQ